MQYALQVFQYEQEKEFRIIDRNGEPWFVLAEICRELEIGNAAQAASRLDADEKGIITIDTLGGPQKTTVINESGLYSVILTSRKDGAKRFKKWVTSEVLPTIRKTGGYQGRVPAFIKRYNANWDRVEQGHFSVLNELAIHIWGRLEHAGHIMADKSPSGTENRPDVSVGRLFSDWLKENHPDVCGDYKMYSHVTPQWEGEARQYPNALLPLFREFVDTVWMEEHFERYFNKRDPAALPYMQKVMLPRHSTH
jgi:prophage antirepressor-like protein